MQEAESVVVVEALAGAEVVLAVEDTVEVAYKAVVELD